MTESTVNPSPEHLVKVTHPDGRSEQVRLDAEGPDEALEAAKRWLAEGRQDRRWLEGEAEHVREEGEDAEPSEPTPVPGPDPEPPSPEPISDSDQE